MYMLYLLYYIRKYSSVCIQLPTYIHTCSCTLLGGDQTGGGEDSDESDGGQPHYNVCARLHTYLRRRCVDIIYYICTYVIYT